MADNVYDFQRKLWLLEAARFLGLKLSEAEKTDDQNLIELVCGYVDTLDEQTCERALRWLGGYQGWSQRGVSLVQVLVDRIRASRDPEFKMTINWFCHHCRAWGQVQMPFGSEDDLVQVAVLTVHPKASEECDSEWNWIDLDDRTIETIRSYTFFPDPWILEYRKNHPEEFD